MNDFGLLVGKYNAALPTLGEDQKNELQVDVNGRLIISGRFLEDSAHASGDAGLHILAVRNDTEGSLVDTNGDYAPLQVDASGRLRVITDIDEVNIEFNAEKAEDSAHASGDIGSYMLAVREDSRPTGANTSASGDYASFFVNANGELYVTDVDALAKLTTMDSSLTGISGILTALSKAEDAAHSSGDQGIMSLSVRHDADTSLVSADGDYAPFQVDSLGHLKVVIPQGVDVVIDSPGTEEYAITDDLTANQDGLIAITALATPWVDVAVKAIGVGETAYVYGWQWACDQNAQARLISDDTTDIVVYKNAVNSSAKPGEAEHFDSNGRIEIPGAADLEIKLQIKKRIAVGGNANGTGSIHIRKV